MRVFNFPFNYEHGSQAYESDLNFVRGAPAPQLSDGRTDTSNANTHYLFDLEGTQARTINAVFVEVFGFDTVTLSADSQSATNVINAHPINTADQLRGTRHYAFVPFLGLTANRLRLTFAGSGRVYQVALTRQLLNLEIGDQISRTLLNHRRVGEGNQRRISANGNARVIPNRAGRWKWRTDVGYYFSPTANPTADQVIDTLDANDSLFVYPQPTDEPTRFYPASLDPPNVDVDFVGNLTTQKELRFTLMEM